MSDRKPPKAAATSPLCLERQLCFALYAASNQVIRQARPALEALGVTYSQYLVLLVLWEHGRSTVSTIGSRLLLDSGTLTPLLKRMEIHGLILRERDRQDERRVLITLAPRGEALRQEACRVGAHIRDRIRMPEAELESLREQLQQLIAALDARGD